MGKVHVSKKLAVPDLDLRGHHRCCLRLLSGALTVNKGQIQPGDSMWISHEPNEGSAFSMTLTRRSIRVQGYILFNAFLLIIIEVLTVRADLLYRPDQISNDYICCVNP
jgi:hypothetical protein